MQFSLQPFSVATWRTWLLTMDGEWFERALTSQLHSRVPDSDHKVPEQGRIDVDEHDTRFMQPACSRSLSAVLCSVAPMQGIDGGAVRLFSSVDANQSAGLCKWLSRRESKPPNCCAHQFIPPQHTIVRLREAGIFT